MTDKKKINQSAAVDMIKKAAAARAQQAQQPVQAFVVANQVTTQQALDRNIIQNASLG